jgi:transposase
MTALAFVLTIEVSGRFRKNRRMGCYLGLALKRDQSGEIDKKHR